MVSGVHRGGSMATCSAQGNWEEGEVLEWDLNGQWCTGRKPNLEENLGIRWCGEGGSTVANDAKGVGGSTAADGREEEWGEGEVPRLGEKGNEAT